MQGDKCGNPNCSIDIIDTNYRRKYCSKACKMAAWRIRHPKKKKKKVIRYCIICNKRLRGRKLYFCSEAHSRVFHHKRERSDTKLRVKIDDKTSILVDVKKNNIQEIKLKYKQHLNVDLNSLKIDTILFNNE